MEGSRFVKICLLVINFCSAWNVVLSAESYADLMFRAEKLTEQRYGKESRAYRIRIAELDSIMVAKVAVEAKKNLLKK